jgi:hypothetical protein
MWIKATVQLCRDANELEDSKLGRQGGWNQVLNSLREPANTLLVECKLVQPLWNIEVAQETKDRTTI